MVDLDALSRVVHRETVRLAVLLAIVVAAFLATRRAAGATAASHRRDAREWFLLAQRADDSPSGRQTRVTALRRASASNPDNREYPLALATALEANGDTDSAAQVLTALRDVVPEDPQVNLQLARLEARRGHVDDSRRYYENALNALWMPATAGDRRNIRLELATLLLAHHESIRALPELLALTTDLPDVPDWQVRVATLLLTAGDAERAREHFLNALEKSPERGDALAGAGVASFALGDYAAARQYLSAAPANDATRDLLAVAREVLTRDPLEPRIRAAERRARTLRMLDQALTRLTSCVGATPDSTAPELDRLSHEAAHLQQEILRSRTEDRDTAEDAIDLAARIESAADNRCGSATTPDDRAILLIGRRRGLAPSSPTLRRAGR